MSLFLEEQDPKGAQGQKEIQEVQQDPGEPRDLRDFSEPQGRKDIQAQ